MGRDGGARRHDRGAAAIELAIVLPLLLLVVLGIVDFGRLLFAEIGLGSASREGARAASVGMPVAQVEAIARASAPEAARLAGLAPGELAVVASPCATGVDMTRVEVSALFRWVTPIGLVRIFTADSQRADTMPISSAAEALCVG